MDPYRQFKDECKRDIDAMKQDAQLHRQTNAWRLAARNYNYSYHFEWLGRPIIQYPQDMAAMQELLWEVKPDLIIETGIAHGGSLILSATILAMIDYSEAVASGKTLDPLFSRRRVLGIDIDIREHNKTAIKSHPLAHKIDMIQGSSTAPEIIEQAYKYAKGYQRIFVCLDSNHTHDHVLAELSAYAPLVAVDSYCVVFDTIIEDTPDDQFTNRPWRKGNNPKTAVWEFLKTHDHFAIDGDIEAKLLLTSAPSGYLKRLR